MSEKKIILMKAIMSNIVFIIRCKKLYKYIYLIFTEIGNLYSNILNLYLRNCN